MRKNWLENNLYNRLKDKPADLDLDHAWKELEARRYPKEDRRKSGFLWSFGMMALALLLGSFYFLNKQLDSQHNELVSESQNSSNIQINTDAEQTATLDSQSIKIQDTESQTNQLNITDATTEKPLTESKQLAAQSTDGQNKADLVQLSQNIAQASTEHQNILNQKNIIKTANSNQEAQQLSIKETQETNFINPNNKVPLVNQTTLNIGQDNLLDNNVSDGVSGGFANSSDAVDLENKMASLTEEIALLESIGLKLFELADSKPIAPKSNLNLKLDTESNLRKRIGLAFSYGNMEGDPILVLEEIRTEYERDELEKPVDYIDGGFTFDMFLNKHLYFKTGLNYSQYTSRYSQIFQSDEAITVEDTIIVIIDPSGTTTYVTDTFEDYQYYQRHNYLKYRTLSIPLGLGLDYSIGQQYSMNVASGVSIGLYMPYEGFYYSKPEFSGGVGADYDDGLVDLGSSYYKKTMLFSGFGSLGIDRHFGNFSIGFSGKYNFDLTNRIHSMYENESTNLTHKMKSFNANLSLKYKF